MVHPHGSERKPIVGRCAAERPNVQQMLQGFTRRKDKESLHRPTICQERPERAAHASPPYGQCYLGRRRRLACSLSLNAGLIPGPAKATSIPTPSGKCPPGANSNVPSAHAIEKRYLQRSIVACKASGYISWNAFHKCARGLGGAARMARWLVEPQLARNITLSATMCP